MTGIFTRNIGWKVLSLGAAVVLWFSVASEPELATLHTVPVAYKGVPDDLEISSRFAEKVLLEVRGPSGRLRDLGDTGPAVVLDFSSVQQPGERTFTIDQNNVSLPRGIELVRAIPAQLRFRFERSTVREVPVEVRLSEPPDGYVVEHADAIPPKLTIVGPQDSVERTHSVVTDAIHIGGVIGTGQFRANAYLAEPQVRFLSSSQVTVRVLVKKR